jgi:hypothetical protein
MSDDGLNQSTFILCPFDIFVHSAREGKSKDTFDILLGLLLAHCWCIVWQQRFMVNDLLLLARLRIKIKISTVKYP